MDNAGRPVPRKLARIGIGYAAALALGLAAVFVNELAIPPDVADASSGMAAFGDLFLFVGVAGPVALVPTWWLLRLALRR
jgi:hypothetical protein